MPPTLRVLSFNVRQLRDDRSAVLAVLRGAEPDVVAIQEPPRGPLGRARLARLARDAGLVVAVGHGGARTAALLVRDGLEVHSRRALRLTWRPGRTRRGLAVADVAGVRVVSVHLSLYRDERARHLTRLLSLLAATAGPVVVAGDLNEQPGGATWRRLGLHLRDVAAGSGPTFPATDPRQRIDAIWATGLATTSSGVVPGDAARRASDHLPVLAELEVL